MKLLLTNERRTGKPPHAPARRSAPAASTHASQAPTKCFEAQASNTYSTLCSETSEQLLQNQTLPEEPSPHSLPVQVNMHEDPERSELSAGPPSASVPQNPAPGEGSVAFFLLQACVVTYVLVSDAFQRGPLHSPSSTLYPTLDSGTLSCLQERPAVHPQVAQAGTTKP